MPPKKSAKKSKVCTDADLIDAIAAKGMVHMPMPDDGDCFYHTILTYLRMRQIPRFAEETVLTLREKTVETMLANKEYIAPYILQSNSNNSNNNGEINAYKKVTEQIESLRTPGLWDLYIGDMVPEYAAKTFGLRLHLYNWNLGKCTLDTMILPREDNMAENAEPAAPLGGAGGPARGARGVTHVHLLRVNDGHFELLFPVADFKGEARAIGASEITRLAREAATKTYAHAIEASTKPDYTAVIRGNYVRQLQNRLADAELGESYLDEESRELANARMVDVDISQINGLIDEVKVTKVKINPAKSTRKKAASTRKKAASISNIKKLVKGLEEASLSNSSGSSSSGKSSAPRRSRRIAKHSKRPPTPPRPAARPNTKRGASKVAPNEESNTNSSKSVGSVKPKGSGTRKKSPVTLAKMRGILESLGTNTNGLNENMIRGLYASLPNA